MGVEGAFFRVLAVGAVGLALSVGIERFLVPRPFLIRQRSVGSACGPVVRRVYPTGFAHGPPLVRPGRNIGHAGYPGVGKQRQIQKPP